MMRNWLNLYFGPKWPRDFAIAILLGCVIGEVLRRMS